MSSRLEDISRWSDAMVYGLHVPDTGRLEAKGIPRGASAATRNSSPIL
jgi:hypothetical protein